MSGDEVAGRANAVEGVPEHIQVYRFVEELEDVRSLVRQDRNPQQLIFKGQRL
ncbi:MAG: hypothetical protein V3V57_12915 [Spirochaetia bacterium]|nr:hypothetical protein [Spirochaetales bacterium]